MRLLKKEKGGEGKRKASRQGKETEWRKECRPQNSTDAEAVKDSVAPRRWSCPSR